MRKKERKFLNEFTVLGVFVAVSLLGFLYGGTSLIFSKVAPKVTTSVVPMQAPTLAAYQQEVGDAMGPFLVEAVRLQEDDIPTVDETFSLLVRKTKAQLLTMRVPSEMRTPHLTFVLLLDQWDRAIGGSEGDRRVVLERTDAVLNENPWVAMYVQTL